MKPIVEYLRGRGVLGVNYLDNFLILGASRGECNKNVHTVTSLLSRLGFIINTEKSVLYPDTRCKFLGFLFYSKTMNIELHLEKREKNLKCIKYFSAHRSCRVLKFAQFLGLLTSAGPAIKYGWGHAKRLERCKFLALLSNGGDYQGRMAIPDYISTDLTWWFKNITTSKNDIRRDHYDHEIYTDAEAGELVVRIKLHMDGGHHVIV